MGDNEYCSCFKHNKTMLFVLATNRHIFDEFGWFYFIICFYHATYAGASQSVEAF